MIHMVCKDILLELKINIFMETGTFVGETVAAVSEWLQMSDEKFGKTVNKEQNSKLSEYQIKKKILYPVFDGADESSRNKLYSVDIDREKHHILKDVFRSNPNIVIVNDESDRFLKKVIDEKIVSDNDRSFFYLDAHWGENWPLRDEITQILRLKKSVIVIDDFVVPFHPFHGFDIYNKKICGWYYISDLFNGINHRIFYTKKPSSDNRGTVIIFIGHHDNDLKFMKSLPCFEPFIKGAPFITLAAKLTVSFLTAVGLYDRLLDLYFYKKWGSVENAPCKRLLKSQNTDCQVEK